MKAVEYSYVSPQDSSITRKVYSNVNINENASSEYFNFKIPEDAKVITNIKLYNIYFLGIWHISFSQNLEEDFNLIKSQNEPLLTAKKISCFHASCH
jgi:hypothetical protein